MSSCTRGSTTTPQCPTHSSRIWTFRCQTCTWASAPRSHGVQTGAMLAALDGVLGEHQPDWVLVYGDTNSTLAGAISAVKLQLRIAHLRGRAASFNRRMPEEHNRILTDHAADLLLAPTEGR